MDLSDLSANPGFAPELGIVSQTLASSSVVKWILPAKIRSPSKNDVVFVGDTSIQLREFVTSGSVYLSEITGKVDFQTQILNAKVLSAKLEPIPTLDAIKNQMGDDERFTIDGQPVEENQPPQILVLSTASSHLIFVYAKQSYNGSTRFVYAKRHLMGDYFPATRLGRHLAVDPESRALAVAPSIGHFSLLSMRSISEIKQQIDSWKPQDPSSFRPWNEQRLAQIDGFVVKMDFLHTPSDDPQNVILALIVANEGQLFLLLYRWDTRTPLHRFKPMRCSGQLLPAADGFPLILIPCVSSLSFLLVTEECLIIYDQVTASQANTTRYTFKASDRTENNGLRRPKKWTQWARPERHLQHRQMHDDIFLIREDGVIEACLIDFANRKVKVTTTVTPGKLGMNVDSAFCLLGGPKQSGGDVIIAVGDMGDGGVFHAQARQHLQRIQTLPNAAPFHDLVLVDSKDKQSLAQPACANPANLFACCGRGDGKSSVAQLHHGLEAQIGGTAEYPDAASIERIFTIAINSTQRLLLLLSHASHTSILATGLHEVDLESTDNVSMPGLEYDQSTLAAALLNDKIVQVTSTSLNIVHVDKLHSGLRFDLRRSRPICAEILADSMAIVLAHVEAHAFALSVCHLTKLAETSTDSPTLVQLATLSTRPLCMQQAVFHDTPLVLVGTETGDIYALDPLAQPGSNILSHFNMGSQVSGLDGTAVTSLCLLYYASRGSGLLLCGLRGGTLLCLDMMTNSAENGHALDLRISRMFSLGNTTTTVLADFYSRLAGSCLSAFVLCRSVMKIVSLRPLSGVSADKAKGVDFEMMDVCLTTRNDTSKPQSICHTMHRTPNLNEVSPMSGMLICVTDNDLLFASLASKSQTILRHYSIPGIPKRMVFSKYLNQLVIATEESQHSESRNDEGSFQVAALCFMPATPNDPESAALARSGNVTIGEPGERVKGLVEYSPSDDQKRFHYEMVVMTLTKEVREPNGAFKPMSRVVCLSLIHIMKGNWSAARAKLVISFPGKTVSALCPMGLSSLLIGAGTEILLHTLDVTTKKWATTARFTLPSPATSVHAEGSLAFIASFKHSLLMLHFNGTKFSVYGSDSAAKRTTNVVGFDKYKAVVTSITEKGTNVIGFAEDRLRNGYGKLFDAQVPLMIDRLRPDYNVKGGRPTFIGITVDGTLYRFTTVNADEWALLDFVQNLRGEDKEPRPISPRQRHAEIAASTAASLPPPTPADMHFNGDRFVGMLEQNREVVRELLGIYIKLENKAEGERETRDRLDGLKKVAQPVVGTSEDVVSAVDYWLRNLLRWPTW